MSREKKSRRPKKLILSRQTVRSLTSLELTQVAGGDDDPWWRGGPRPCECRTIVCGG